MKIFWPNRSKAKGFSIDNLASKYREKISNLSSDKTSNQISAYTNLKSRIEDSNQIKTLSLSKKRGHWANRDFSEYLDAA